NPAKKPASQARWVGLAGPTTRLRMSISSSANGAVLGIGEIFIRASLPSGARLDRAGHLYQRGLEHNSPNSQPYLDQKNVFSWCRSPEDDLPNFCFRTQNLRPSAASGRSARISSEDRGGGRRSVRGPAACSRIVLSAHTAVGYSDAGGPHGAARFH